MKYITQEPDLVVLTSLLLYKATLAFFAYENTLNYANVNTPLILNISEWAGNTNRRGRISTVNLLTKVAYFA